MVANRHRCSTSISCALLCLQCVGCVPCITHSSLASFVYLYDTTMDVCLEADNQDCDCGGFTMLTQNGNLLSRILQRQPRGCPMRALHMPTCSAASGHDVCRHSIVLTQDSLPSRSCDVASSFQAFLIVHLLWLRLEAFTSFYVKAPMFVLSRRMVAVSAVFEVIKYHSAMAPSKTLYKFVWKNADGSFSWQAHRRSSTAQFTSEIAAAKD